MKIEELLPLKVYPFTLSQVLMMQFTSKQTCLTLRSPGSSEG